jgi:hypothetical protein
MDTIGGSTTNKTPTMESVDETVQQMAEEVKTGASSGEKVRGQ